MMIIPSCRLASAQLGSHPFRIMTACSTVSTRGGGLPYDLISVISFLLSDSKAETSVRNNLRPFVAKVLLSLEQSLNLL